MTIVTKTLIGIASFGVAVAVIVGLSRQDNQPLELALLGNAAKELTMNSGAVGFLSSQQLCSPSVFSRNELSASGAFVSAYHESEFDSDLKRLKTFELLNLEPEFRGLGIKGATPLSWARKRDIFFARQADGSIVSIDPQSAQFEYLDSKASDKVTRLNRVREYQGSKAGFLMFGPSPIQKNIALVDMENNGRVIQISTEFEDVSAITVSCPVSPVLESVCRVTAVQGGGSGVNPLKKSKATVQVADFSVSSGKLVAQQFKTSPELVMADYVGETSNKANLWLGYNGNNRNLIIQDSNNQTVEIDGSIGDIQKAYLQANDSIVLENFENEITKYSTIDFANLKNDSRSGLIQKPHRLIAANANHLLVYSPEQEGNYKGSITLVGKVNRLISLGCTHNTYTGAWTPLADAGYYDFLPKLKTPIGLLVYFHGGPFQLASDHPSALISAWLDKGYQVWALDAPGTPGFGLSHFLPTSAYIRQYVAQLEQRIRTETQASTQHKIDSVRTVFMGHSFGGFSLIQLSKIITAREKSALVLVNSSCRDFNNLKSANGMALKYAHAKAAGEAYQALSEANSDVANLCKVSTGHPTFVFVSDGDLTVPKAHSEIIAKASQVDLLTLKNEGHVVGLSSAQSIVEIVDKAISQNN